ncbi:atlastin-like, partial [Contarinia nasturtii]|uniref:atlastin-like n=1 Tax=Contarinia nasturtii TaxID=265458 RepID=UPI0012D3F0A0
MKFAAIIPCALLLFGVVIGADMVEHSIQIISPNKNHSFVLEIDELKTVLEADAIKDRDVVVISIAGAFRQGKSFLLNFFLKYLEAQYKKHDVLDWLGENKENSTLSGFEWASGRKRKTVGIWMWSEIYTHDFENGEKVAIILLDTQGIFDDQTSVKECTTIFVLSTMISSIQCYNLMQNIGEDDLQHLQLFTEYGKVALQHTNTKQFQKLLFIVRDWPYPEDTYYGWRQEIIDEILDGNDEQTDDMQQLRKEIRSSFDEIGAFLMPHPGMTVARKKNFNGSLKQIDPEFLKFAKELSQDLFAPENLLIKNINGQNVRARDLVHYLREYTNLFNNNTLPEPQPMYEGKAKLHNEKICFELKEQFKNRVLVQINNANSTLSNGILPGVQDFLKQFDSRKMGDVDVSGVMRDQFENALYDFLSMVNQAFETHNDSINEYNNFMTKSINGIETYFKQNKLKDIHELAKENSKSQKSANEHNEKLSVELIDTIKQSVGVALDTFGRILDENEFGNVTNKIERAAIQDFDLKKIDDGEVAVREKLIQKVDVIHSELLNIVHAYNRYLKQYNHSMEEYIEKSSSYLKRDELIELHRDTKKQSIDKFEAASLGNYEDISTVLQRKLDKEIECQNLINSLVKNAGEEWLVEIKRPAAAWGDEELNEKFKSWKETIFRS